MPRSICIDRALKGGFHGIHGNQSGSATAKDPNLDGTDIITRKDKL